MITVIPAEAGMVSTFPPPARPAHVAESAKNFLHVGAERGHAIFLPGCDRHGM